MSDNAVYKISKLMNDPNLINNELEEAVAVLNRHFRKKYIEPIKEQLMSEKTKSISQPSNEVILLQACRPYIKSDKLDAVIDLFNNIDTLKNLSANISAQSLPIDTSIHPDGIYDIDKNCITTSEKIQTKHDSPIIFVLIAILLFTK